MLFFVEGLDLHAKCCSTVAIMKDRSRNHICRHGNSIEYAETAGCTIMYTKQTCPTCVGMRTAIRLIRQKLKDDKDAHAVEVNFWSTLGQDRE